jgi:glycosyltransferase involved in cell wall biosynthesis
MTSLVGRRVVHVTTTDMSLSLLLGPQLRAFADAGMDVIGVSAPGPFVSELTDWGIRHEPLRHATRSVAVGHDLAAMVELERLFRRLRPDIVHTHNPKPGLYGRLAARAARVPGIVNTVHGLYATPEDPWGRRAIVYLLERTASTCSDVELVQNREDLDVLRRLRVPTDKLVLLGNGVDLKRFTASPGAASIRTARTSLGVSDDATVVGTVGRLVYQKGFRELFAAAARLRYERPDVVFVVIGPEDPAKGDSLTTEDLASARALGNIIFAGHRDNVEELYPGFDLFVLPSYREGFPRSAMEAAACGLPVIATDIRGCRQAVSDGATGLLVPLRDAERLGHAIIELADDPARRKAMGAKARRKAEAEFDDQVIIERTLSAYRRVVESATSRTSRRIRSQAIDPS